MSRVVGGCPVNAAHVLWERLLLLEATNDVTCSGVKTSEIQDSSGHASFRSAV